MQVKRILASGCVFHFELPEGCMVGPAVGLLGVALLQLVRACFGVPPIDDDLPISAAV